ncbi:MAG TPA: hypothetical protein VF881_08810 [Polyangiaceae bacterium]
MMTRSKLVLILAAVSITPACGGADEPQKPFSSGLPPDATLGSLSDSEASKLCSSSAQFLLANPVVQEGTCRLAGGITAAFDVLGGTAQTDADVQASCARGYDQCEAALTADAGTNSTCKRPLPTCTATVAEYEACTSDSVPLYERLATELPVCKDVKRSDIGIGDGGTKAPALEAPPSCAALKSKCPELFSSSSGA